MRVRLGDLVGRTLPLVERIPGGLSEYCTARWDAIGSATVIGGIDAERQATRSVTYDRRGGIIARHDTYGTLLHVVHGWDDDGHLELQLVTYQPMPYYLVGAAMQRLRRVRQPQYAAPAWWIVRWASAHTTVYGAMPYRRKDSPFVVDIVRHMEASRTSVAEMMISERVERLYNDDGVSIGRYVIATSLHGDRRRSKANPAVVLSSRPRALVPDDVIDALEHVDRIVVRGVTWCRGTAAGWHGGPEHAPHPLIVESPEA